MQRSKTVWSLICLLVTGCASSQGFDRTAIIEALRAHPNHQPFSNKESSPSPPLRLGVFFVNHDFPNRQSIQKVEWLTMDREHLLHQLAPLQDEQILVDTFVLMDVTLQGENIQGIKKAGARYGADVVLIIDGAAAVDRYNNAYAWLYPTLVGAYLAPGTESDALVMINGSLWAVRSEWRTEVQTAEGVAKLVGSAVFVEDAAAIQEAKKQAIQTLVNSLAEQLRLLK